MLWRPSSWRQWWLARLPTSDDHVLTQRNVYILPTRAGWMLALTLLLLLLASINYQLNLGYLLTFLLAGSSVVGMHMAHANLRGLHLQWRTGSATFAGQATDVLLTLHNPSRRTRYGIALRWGDDKPDQAVWADAPARASGQATLRWTPQQRGRIGLPAIVLETRFPMGSFRVWTWWRPASPWLVYPAPEAAPPPWPGENEQEHGTRAPSTPLPDGERTALRPYRRGDPLKWVAWKKPPKTPTAIPRTGSAATPNRPARAALAASRSLRLDRGRTATLALVRLGAGRRAAGPGLRPDAARLADHASARSGTPSPLPGGLGMPLNPFQRMASGSRETRDTLFLLGVIAGVLLLQLPHLPLWCSAMGVGVLALRAALAVYQRPLPAARWRIGLLLLAVGATWASYRTLLGQDAGVTLVFVLLALKTLELRARRDAFVVFFLGFFALLTHFFYSQSLLTAFGIALALWGLLTALVNAHMPAGRPPLAVAARLSGTMMLVGTPIMVALFLLFPRVSPLWGLPSTNTGRSGLSAQVEVGQMAQIALDDSVALHVEFDGAPPPTGEMYFRGPVLTRFDGRTWSPSYRPPIEPVTWGPDGASTRYRVTQEPNGLPWLLTLEATAQAPTLPAQTVTGTADLQWRTQSPLSAVARFTAVAHTHYRYAPREADLAVREALQLPAGFNPRTQRLAQQLLTQVPPSADPTSADVQLVLALLRQGGYRYTLEPGLYGRHTADEFWFDRKAGFCEHIASAFVVLMRAMGVPARMVTGYQGGERNPIDGFWVVRQRDAHAWAEVWHPRLGWLRVDPTAAVAPERTDGQERLEAPPGLVTATLLRVTPT